MKSAFGLNVILAAIYIFSMILFKVVAQYWQVKCIFKKQALFS